MQMTFGDVNRSYVVKAKLTNSKKPQMVNGQPFIQLGKWNGYTPDRTNEKVSIWVGVQLASGSNYASVTSIKPTFGRVSNNFVLIPKLTNSKKPQVVNGISFYQLGKWDGYTPDRTKEKTSIWVE